MAMGSPALKRRRISGGDGASGGSDYVPPLGPLLSDHATVLVVAGCGTGKSKRIRDWIGKAENASKRVLMVSTRLIHAHDLAASFAELGFVCYTDRAIGELAKNRRVICSLESMHRLAGAELFDVVVLDEVRTLAAVYAGDTVKSEVSFRTLEFFFRGARHRIAADADGLCDEAVDKLLLGLGGAGYHKHVLERPRLIRRLKVRFDGGGKETLWPEILEAVRRCAGAVAVCCGGKSRAKEYARKCSAAGIAYKAYHGDSDDAEKQNDFQNPDAAWADVACIIFTVSLSVAVDPKQTVFSKIFMDTHRHGGSMRDMFQGLCRFGRFDGGLLNDTITVQLHCADPGDAAFEAPPKPESKVSHKTAAEKTAQELRWGCRQAVAPPAGPFTPQRFDCWKLELRAIGQEERDLNSRAHYHQFKKFAELRGWAVERDGSERPSNKDAKSAAAPATEDQRIANAEDVGVYTEIRAEIETTGTEGRFFEDCVGLAGQAGLNGRDKAKVRIFHTIRRVGAFVSEDEYTKLQRHGPEIERAAEALCLTPALAAKADKDLFARNNHPDLSHQKMKAPFVEAHREAAKLLGVKSILDGSELSPEWLAALNGADDKGPETEELKHIVKKAWGGVARIRKGKLLGLLESLGVVFAAPLKLTRARRVDPETGKRVRSVVAAEFLPLAPELVRKIGVMCPVCRGSVSAGQFEAHREACDAARIEADFASGAHRATVATEHGAKLEIVNVSRLRELRGKFPTETYLALLEKKIGPSPADSQKARVECVYYRKKESGGRRFASAHSLQNCPSRFRGHICGEYYHDIDLINFLLTLAEQVAERHKLDVPYVNQYVRDRETQLGKVMAFYSCTRTAAKKLFIRLGNGGGVSKWLQDFDLRAPDADPPAIIWGVGADCKRIQGEIRAKYPEHSSLAGFSQIHEDAILSAMEAYFVDVLGYDGGSTVLIFDGIMVPKRADRPITDSDLAKASGYIEEKTGWRVKLAEKPLSPLA